MIGINKKFNYDKNIYDRDEYTKIFFTKIKLILFNQKPRKDEINNDKINKTLLLVLIIYLYFVKNNMEDPYILIKLNKLLRSNHFLFQKIRSESLVF